MVKTCLRWIYTSLAAIILLSSVSYPGGNRTTAQSTFKIVGVLSAWTQAYLSSDISGIDFSKLTHLVWSEVFVTGASDPTLTSPWGWAQAMTWLDAAVAAGHAKGVLVIGSLYSDPGFSITTIVDNSTLRAQLVSNLSALVVAHNLDGIDLDCEELAAYGARYDALIDDLYTALHPSGKLITVSGGWAAENFSLSRQSKVDLINLMTYGMVYPPAVNVLPIHAAYQDAITAMQMWSGHGFTKSKLTMGVPFYGTDGDATTVLYDEVVAAINPPHSQNQASMASISTPHRGVITITGGVLWWNGVDLAKQKADWVIANGYGGVMCFDVGMDRFTGSQSLLQNIYGRFYPPSPSPPAGVAATDGTLTDRVTITWAASAGATGYRVYRDGTDISGALGAVVTFDDSTAARGTIAAGSTIASDGANTNYVSLALSGTATSHGATYTYKVRAFNSSGTSGDSNANTGYVGIGSLTYQWQRSAADSNASYSNLPTGITAMFSDTTAPIDGAGRYYRCVLNATGASQAISTPDRGYRLYSSPAPTTVPPVPTPSPSPSSSGGGGMGGIALFIFGTLAVIFVILEPSGTARDALGRFTKR